MSTIDNTIAHYFRTLEGNPRFDQLMIGMASLGDIFSLVLVANRTHNNQTDKEGRDGFFDGNRDHFYINDVFENPF